MTTLTTTLGLPIVTLQNLTVALYNSNPVQSALHKLGVDSALTNYPKYPSSYYFEKVKGKDNNTSYFLGNFELSIGKLKQ